MIRGNIFYILDGFLTDSCSLLFTAKTHMYIYFEQENVKKRYLNESDVFLSGMATNDNLPQVQIATYKSKPKTACSKHFHHDWNTKAT